MLDSNTSAFCSSAVFFAPIERCMRVSSCGVPTGSLSDVLPGLTVSTDLTDAYAQLQFGNVDAFSSLTMPVESVGEELEGLSAVFFRRAASRPSPYSSVSKRPSRSLVALQSLAMCPS